MTDGQRVDWRAIPGRYRRWQALPVWRKLLWVVTRSVTMVLLYGLFAAVLLWYNEPATLEAIWTGSAPLWALLGLMAAQPELLALLLVLVPAVAAAVLLPHRPDWR